MQANADGEGEEAEDARHRWRQCNMIDGGQTAGELEEADERLASGWHVDPSGLNPQDSPQRRRYLKTVDGYGRPKDQDVQRQST